VATHEGIQASLARLASGVGADRVTILPPDAAGDSMGVPAEIFSRVVADAKPVVWTEAPSHRPQRRTNVEVTSTLLAPVVGSEVLAVIVCRRHARRGFDSSELEVALRAAEALSGAVASAASGAHPAADQLDPSTARAS
jgi:GAF domain-containing protein